MLLNKLKPTVAMFLVALALAAGSASFTYRAHATEPPDRTTDADKPKARSIPGEGVREEIPSENGGTASAEAPKEDGRRANDAAQVTTEEPKPSARLAENWQGGRQRKLDAGKYSFMASRTGNAALAYDAATRDVKAIRLNATKEQPLWVTPVAVNNHVVALGVQGANISRVALFNLKSGKWTPLDLDQPVNGGVWPMSFGPDTAAYEVGEFLYLFNPKTEAFDRLDLRTIADDQQEPRTTKGR